MGGRRDDRGRSRGRASRATRSIRSPISASGSSSSHPSDTTPTTTRWPTGSCGSCTTTSGTPRGRRCSTRRPRRRGRSSSRRTARSRSRSPRRATAIPVYLIQDYHLALVPGMLRELRPGRAHRPLHAHAVRRARRTSASCRRTCATRSCAGWRAPTSSGSRRAPWVESFLLSVRGLPGIPRPARRTIRDRRSRGDRASVPGRGERPLDPGDRDDARRPSRSVTSSRSGKATPRSCSGSIGSSPRRTSCAGSSRTSCSCAATRRGRDA